jgi:stage V sporulation protein B
LNRKAKKDIYSIDERYFDIFKVIIMTMIPIILGQTFYQISAMIDDIMYGKIMLDIGVTSEEITRAIGNYNSSYVILTGVVMGVASAMSTSMLPSIVASKAQYKYEEISEKISATIKTNMMIAIPSFVGLVILGRPIVQLLFAKYDSVEGGMMLRIGGIAVIFYTISTVTSSALQGIDKMKLPVIHSSISLAIHIVLVFVLLKFTNLGIYAIVIGSTTFPVVVMILNLVALNRYVGYIQEVIQTFLIPSICAFIMGIFVVLTYNFFIMITNSNFVALIFAMIMAAISYFGPIYMCKKKGLY